MANAFNQYFTSVEPRLAAGIQHTNSPVERISVEFSMYLNPTCSKEILRIIASIIDNATGVDSVKANVVKHAALLIVKLLATLVNQLFQIGYFPSILKVAIFSPIYKGRSQVELGNYCLISVLTIKSKVFERAMHV